MIDDSTEVSLVTELPSIEWIRELGLNTATVYALYGNVYNIEELIDFLNDGRLLTTFSLIGPIRQDEIMKRILASPHSSGINVDNIHKTYL